MRFCRKPFNGVQAVEIWNTLNANPDSGKLTACPTNQQHRRCKCKVEKHRFVISCYTAGENKPQLIDEGAKFLVAPEGDEGDGVLVERLAVILQENCQILSLEGDASQAAQAAEKLKVCYFDDHVRIVRLMPDACNKLLSIDRQENSRQPI